MAKVLVIQSVLDAIKGLKVSILEIPKVNPKQSKLKEGSKYDHWR
jgi:hypothetical protein